MTTSTQTMTKLEHEVIEAKESVGGDTWNVEAIDHAGEGEIYMASFIGPKARERAAEYARFKNGTPSALTKLTAQLEEALVEHGCTAMCYEGYQYEVQVCKRDATLKAAGEFREKQGKT